MASGLSKLAGHLGWPSALRTYLLGKFGREPFAVRLASYPEPIWMRPRTADRNMFADVLLDREYAVDLDPPPAWILDAGANVGYTSLFFATRWPQARIIALEPAADNHAVLLRNVAHLPQVTAMRGALWSRPTHLYVENPDDVTSGYRMAESAQPRPDAVPATTVCELMREHHVPAWDIVKIDIEGGETEVFAADDVDDWLSRTRLLICELHERFRPQARDTVMRALARHPHRMFRQGDNLLFDLRPE